MPEPCEPSGSLTDTVREAVAKSRLAYGFSANSYSYSCMSACLAAERALGVLREALEREEEAS